MLNFHGKKVEGEEGALCSNELALSTVLTDSSPNPSLNAILQESLSVSVRHPL